MYRKPFWVRFIAAGLLLSSLWVFLVDFLLRSYGLYDFRVMAATTAGLPVVWIAAAVWAGTSHLGDEAAEEYEDEDYF